MTTQSDLIQESNNIVNNTGFSVKKIFKKGIVPIVLFTIINIVFAMIYLLFCNDPEDWNGMDEEDDPLFKKLFNRLYFSLTTLTTVGYGDISPKSIKAKIVVMLHFTFVFFNTITVIL